MNSDIEIIKEIKSFLEGYNSDLKYMVNVETDPNTNYAECIIHEPNSQPRIEKIKYEPFLYMKDLSKHNIKLYDGYSEELIESKKIKYGINIIKLKTGNQKRLVDGYCYKITSYRSYNDIINYLKDGGVNPYEKLTDDDGAYIKDKNGEYIYKYRNLFYAPKTTEQFFISTKSRLYKGFEQYNNVHRLTFDIETTGLRYQIHRILLIGVKDNRGFEIILEPEKIDDDESEIRLIQDFFNLINYIKPAIICGYNSEMFDFDFILGRAKILNMDLSALPTTLKREISLKRKPNTSVKIGSTTENYTSTYMWGFSVTDILHAVKKTAAINTEIKETGLKYISKFENVAKSNRTYIKGEDNIIGKYYIENKFFLINDNNEYVQIPDEYFEIAKKIYKLQLYKNKISQEEYKNYYIKYISENQEFVIWLKNKKSEKNYNKLITGRNLVKQYLLDDLYETEKIDELYNESSFMLSKIVPTTYHRICTMGTASIWNLLLIAWSYENDLAIPEPDKQEKFSGGLARCFKSGYSKKIVKIDYASLYPMLQLTWSIFPAFDITGVMKKMLLYLTTTRNIFKKIGNGDKLKDNEVYLLSELDNDMYIKYINNILNESDLLFSKIKQLPIKILNNSLFGALGSNISFNWSDNVCAARITCTGRIELRHAIYWFNKFGCIPLLAVTDGINFQIPEKTNIRVVNGDVYYNQPEDTINVMWNYYGETGIHALIDKYNNEEMRPPYMKVDNDGENISCLNLSRINYATLTLKKDKKTGINKEKIKLTGNTIKSKVMPDYIEEFIDKGLDLILHGKGKEFVEYYYNYVDDIRYMRIPLVKIASKSKIKTTISAYLKRGKDKNGRDKGKQAHMELLIEKRNKTINELFEKHLESFNIPINKNLTIEEKYKYVINYMPKEPELDSVVYYVNCGYKKSHGDTCRLIDKITGEERFAAVLIDLNNPENNPKLYNYEKYIDAFNKRVSTLLVGFKPEVAKKILVKLDKNGNLIKSDFNPLYNELELVNFDLDTIEDSMYLEEPEVDFWNKTGYDPRKIWNGFKMRNDYKVHYDIYENALNYLNEKMIKANKPLIKSINVEYSSGDLVLIKEDKHYHVALYNGMYLQIVRENVDIPKSSIEIEIDKRIEENQNKIYELKTSELLVKTDKDYEIEANIKKRMEYFIQFKQKYKIPLTATMEQVFSEIENAQDAFEDFIYEIENETEKNVNEYLDIDDIDYEY